ncbi:formimidoylglutamase [Rhodocytophaga rosea]|uniref:Formimidoylglutamase n=1 Tax=Rhodocytophaga rosea TaxID=2704465 RepID=A0A6C0GFD6_9BACT|nr:formimidoylglutamase [Rhodocytophaga rosea]QHT66637.1 formimidoylglutamase [Rhodocytophaga rosea]
MNLTIFFDPVDETILSDQAEADSWQHSLRIHLEKMPAWKKSHLALLGVPEERGTLTNKGTYKAAAAIRKALYPLKKGNHAYKISDLGDLRPGITLEDTYLRLQEVCETLLHNNVIPVILGGSHDLDYGQYRAHENLPMRVSLLNVDALMDMSENEKHPMSRRHIHDILMHEPNYLFTFSHLAYQTYLTSAHDLAILEKLYFEAYRLGQIRENIQEIEPLIRESTMMSFDITAIKLSDAPGNAQAHAFGLTGEEACQICWYAGLNEKMASVGFYEYNPDYDHRNQTAEVVATMIWYFVEGFYHRKKEVDFSDKTYTKYVVPLSGARAHDVIFYKNTLNEKWWMEVPYPSKPNKVSIVPCSYTDYQAALKGELPQRWINRYAKLV